MPDRNYLKKFFMLLNSSSNTTSTELDVSLKLSFIDLLLSQDVYQEKLTFSERERYISTLITQNDNPSYSVSSTSTKELVGRIHLPSGWKYYYRHPNDPEYTVTTIDGYKY